MSNPNESLINLAKHILSMSDDAHFCEHPEWHEIVKEAEAARAHFPKDDAQPPALE